MFYANTLKGLRSAVEHFLASQMFANLKRPAPEDQWNRNFRKAKTINVGVGSWYTMGLARLSNETQ